MIREEHPRVNVHGLQFFFLPLLFIHAGLDQRPPARVGRNDQLSSTAPLATTASPLLRFLHSLPTSPYKKLSVDFCWVSKEKMSLDTKKRSLVVGRLVILLLNQPVLNDGGGGAGGNSLLALDLDGHGLVLLQAAGEIGLLGGLGGLGDREGLDLTDGIRVLDGGGLVSLELLQVQLLDKVGCERLLVSHVKRPR